MKVLAINGSYRDDGVTDSAVGLLLDKLTAAGHNTEQILLRDHAIEFCLNCRACTQEPGTTPGICVHHDGMAELVVKLEEADAYILASPTNFGSVTAVFKRFMERLTVYGFWPWGQNYPIFRKAKNPGKKALLVTSSSAPGMIGRYLFDTRKQLKMTAKILGAVSVGEISIGMISKFQHPELDEKSRTRLTRMASYL